METKETSILLVEDDIITTLMEKKQLEDYGYTVHHAKTGEEALRIVAEKLLPVDVSSHTEREVVEKTEKITGFGLTLVKMLTEELKGTFTMRKDHGTTSIVQFEV